MSKKDFSGGLNTLLEGSKQDKPAQDEPVKPPEIKQEAVIPAKDKRPKYYREPRATFLIDTETVNTIKAIAYWERKTIKEVIKEALNTAINSRNPEDIEKAKTEFNKLNKK